MTWPTTNINTTHMDAGSDLVSQAREDIKQMADNVNLIKDSILLNSASNGQILKYNSANTRLEPFTYQATPTSWTAQQYVSQTTMTASPTVSWDVSVNQTAKITLNQNITLANPSNQQAGGCYVLQITQDGVGSRLITFGSAYKFAGGVKPVLTTAAGGVDLLVFFSDGTNMLGSFLRDLK
jgi:hypothetical protein